MVNFFRAKLCKSDDFGKKCLENDTFPLRATADMRQKKGGKRKNQVKNETKWRKNANFAA